MKKRVFVILFLSILFVSLVSGISQTKISPKVYSELKDNGKVRVVVDLKDEEETSIINKKNIITEFDNSFTADISSRELELLKKSDKVEHIEIDIPTKIFLHESTIIINATAIWGRQISWINLTGSGQSVCVIDSGVNAYHPDFNGKILKQYCYCSVKEGENSNCCPNGEAVDNNASDNDGHGTHVAGIVGAAGGINGVAIGANFVVIKVTNSSGDGIGSDLQRAIQKCTDDSDEFNISVITISLGGSVGYSGYCDIVSQGITNAINNATAKNISVVIATGNQGDKVGISWPSCVENAIPIGWSNKDDTTNIQSNRNWMVQLFAPGTNINSACVSGGYCIMSGTSMSAPHVAGAIAIINQFLKLTQQSKTPQQIESILSSTGELLDDSSESGLNYSRVDIYKALLSLDFAQPIVTLASPTDNSVSVNKNQSFICNASDFELKNVTFYLWNLTDLVNQTSSAISGAFNEFKVNISNINYGDYNWNCLFYDENNNGAFADSNFSLTIGGVGSYLLSPDDGNYTNIDFQEFNCRVESEQLSELVNLTFYLWNSSSLVYEESREISGFDNSTAFNFSLEHEGIYRWNCLGINNFSNFSFGNKNFSLAYDLSSPEVFLISPINGHSATGNSEIEFNFNFTDTFNISSCDLILNNVVVRNSFSSPIYYLVSPGNYIWSVNCSDLAGNVGNSSEQSLIVNPALLSGGSSGSSSSSSASSAPKKNSTQTKILNETLDKGVIKFNITLGAVGDIYQVGTHKLIIREIGMDYAIVLIDSTQYNLKVKKGLKLNLTSDNYYDLHVELQEILNNRINLNAELIYEQINSEENLPVHLFTGSAIEPSLDLTSFEKKEILIYLASFFAGIFVFVLGRRVLKRKKKKKKKKVPLKVSKNKC